MRPPPPSVVTVRSGASVGTRAVVLYDAVVGEGVKPGALSLLMKGERLMPGTRWQGIPAEAVAERHAAAPALALALAPDSLIRKP